MKTDIITTACNDLSCNQDKSKILETYLETYGRTPQKVSDFAVYKKFDQLINTLDIEEVFTMDDHELEFVKVLIMAGLLAVRRIEGKARLLIKVGETNLLAIEDASQDVYNLLVMLLMEMSIDLVHNTSRCERFVVDNVNIWDRNNQVILDLAIKKLYAMGGSKEQIAEALNIPDIRVEFFLTYQQDEAAQLDNYRWFKEDNLIAISELRGHKSLISDLFADVLVEATLATTKQISLKDIIIRNMKFSMN